jgi:hypothetical protein
MMTGLHRARSWLRALVILGAAAVHGEPHVLQPAKAIGVPWRLDAPGWMSFVAFSADGAMVASDGPASTDEIAGDLTEWTFPEGRLVRQFKGIRPEALSADWRYDASYDGVWDVASGRQVSAQQARHTFSSDARQVAELGGPKGGAIRIIELESGAVVTAFGTYTPHAAAFSPDGSRLAAGYWDEVLLWSTSGQRQAALRGFGRYVVALWPTAVMDGSSRPARTRVGCRRGMCDVAGVSGPSPSEAARFRLLL